MDLFICISNMNGTTYFKIKFKYLVLNINYTLRRFSKIKINQLTFLINSQISQKFRLFLFQSNFISFRMKDKTKITKKRENFVKT